MIDRTRAISVGLSLAFHGALLAAGWMTLGRMVPPSITIQGGTGADAGGGEFSFLPASDDQTISSPAKWHAAIDPLEPVPQPETALSPQALPTMDQALVEGESSWPAGGVELPDPTGDADSTFGPGNGSGTDIPAPSAQVLVRLLRGSPPILAAVATGGGGNGPQPGNGDGDGIVAGPPVPSSRNKPPKYPDEARRRGLAGTVVLHLRIAADGRVTQVSVADSCGHDILDRSAIEAVKQWVFNPATIDGKPQAWEGDQAVQFVLRG